MSVAAIFLLFAVWSSVFSFGKFTLSFSSPLFLTGSRMLLGGLLLIGYLFFFKKRDLRIDRRGWLSIILLAFFSIYLTNVLEFWGLQYLSAAKTCFLYSLSPFFTALLSFFHFKERMTLTKWLGLMVGFMGMLPVVFLQTGSEEFLNPIGFFSLPTLAVVGAVLTSVYGWIFLRMIVKDQKISTFTANGTSMLIGGGIALLHSLFVDTWNPLPIQEGSGSLFAGSVVLMTLLYNVACYNIYGLMLRRFTATFLSFVGLLSPIFASISGWLLLGEIPSWTIFLSTGIVSIGLWIVYRTELRQGYIVSENGKNAVTKI